MFITNFQQAIPHMKANVSVFNDESYHLCGPTAD